MMEDIPDSGKVLCRKAYNFDNIEEGRTIADAIAAEVIYEYIMERE